MFTLDRVVPWGRSFAEYRRMFALSDADLNGRILGCADGPASFNAEATRLGCQVTSCDPLYRYDADEIRTRIDGTFDMMIDQTQRNAHEFVWDFIRSVQDLAHRRAAAMAAFLEDYAHGRRDARYVDAALPSLPFDDHSFTLAVCSHFLFLYSDQLDEGFHIAAMRELTRVAREVRVFPLLALGARPSIYVSPVAEALRHDGHDVAIVAVPYEFVRGGNQMLRVT
jgi:hypothetical protein